MANATKAIIVTAKIVDFMAYLMKEAPRVAGKRGRNAETRDAQNVLECLPGFLYTLYV